LSFPAEQAENTLAEEFIRCVLFHEAVIGKMLEHTE